MTVIGYLLGDIAVAECGRTAIVIIGVCIAEAFAAYALGQRRDIILRIIRPAEIMLYDVISVSLDYTDEPVGAVVQIVFGREQSPAGDCAVCYRDGTRFVFYCYLLFTFFLPRQFSQKRAQLQ